MKQYFTQLSIQLLLKSKNKTKEPKQKNQYKRLNIYNLDLSFIQIDQHFPIRTRGIQKLINVNQRQITALKNVKKR